eukprot:COSAG02_NODE_2631_length_8391_cov_16.487096_1_plen_805_part_00
MSDAGSSSSTMDGLASVDLGRLLPAILQTFALVLLGAVANQYSLVPPAAAEALGAYTAKFALPALIFRQIAQLQLGACSPGLLMGMLVAKVAVAVLVAAVTCCLSGGGPGVGQRERGWSMAAIFAMLTTMQNDFALGLPILDALYPSPEKSCEEGAHAPHTLTYSDYLYLFAPISVMIINPLCFAVLEFANSIARRKHSPDAAHERIGCWFICRQVLLPTISNPVVFCVGLGLLANGAKVSLGVEMPSAVDEALQTLGASFSALALFCLGMSMTDDDKGDTDVDDDAVSDDNETEGEQPATVLPPVRSARLSVADIRANAGVRDPDKSLGSSRWIAALLLVVVKSLLLPIVARTTVLLLTGSVEHSRFAFVYATFPAAPSVYLFATRFKFRSRDLAHVSLTTLLGTLLAAPIMFVTAQMATITSVSGTSDQFTEVLQAAEEIGKGSMFFSAWTLLVVISMLVSRDAQGRGYAWRRQHVVWAVFFLSLTQLLYTGLNAVCVPIKGAHPDWAHTLKDCTLTIEGCATASRLWGVVLLVAEIHLGHSNAAAQSGGIWRLLRAGKYVVLWVGWVLPSIWVGTLVFSQLWSKLDLECWSCFSSQPGHPDVYVIRYRLAASGVAAGLAAIAIGCLIWAQRQVADVDLKPRSRKRLGVEARQEAALQEALLGGHGSPRPSDEAESPGSSIAVNATEDVNQAVIVWQSVHLRTVGLCNLIGLLAQVAVGVATLLPDSADGIMLEILALNHFCLFAQGIATGVMLGGFRPAPLVASLSRVVRQVARCWRNTKSQYVVPERWSQWSPATEPELN